MTQKPLILAVETSGRLGSVALAAGEELLGETGFSAAMKHSAEVFPATNELLSRFGRKPKEIEHIYISIGPGSFTGLRIATTLAKTMSLAAGTKIVAVDTLDVIAANVRDYVNSEEGKSNKIGRVGVILDAKRGQFFAAVYENDVGRWEKSGADRLMTAEQFIDEYGGGSEAIWLLGEGLQYYKQAFEGPGIEFVAEGYWYPKASKVHQLGLEKALRGEFADGATLVPTYMRTPNAKPPSWA